MTYIQDAVFLQYERTGSITLKHTEQVDKQINYTYNAKVNFDLNSKLVAYVHLDILEIQEIEALALYNDVVNKYILTGCML